MNTIRIDVPSTFQALAEKFINPLTAEIINDDNELLSRFENLYWHQLKVNRDNSLPEYIDCIKSSFEQLVFEICKTIPVLSSILPTMESRISTYLENRLLVPIVGVALLDKSMNYILLVQSYFDSAKCWTFPKGVKEAKETPTHCACKYADEFLSFNIKKKLIPHTFIEKNIRGYTVRLLIAKDISMDFEFKPKVQHAIRRIQWFSIWDLPQTPEDPEAFARFELQPNDLTTVEPFVTDLKHFILSSRRNEQVQKKTSDVSIGKRNSSAFMPVVPKKLSAGTSSQSNSSTNISIQPLSPLSVATNESGSSDTVFKPLTMNSQCSPITQQSFTGLSFLQMVTNKKSPNIVPGVITDSTTEIKHPKPIHPSKLTILTYESPDTPTPSDIDTDGKDVDADKMQESTTLDNTAELCLSALESILKTPAVESKPLPGSANIALISPAEGDFARTPKSSRGRRPRRKTRKSQNGDRESVSPTQFSLGIPEESSHVHEQGIDINVGDVVRNQSSQEPNNANTKSLQKHTHPIHAPVATTRSYTLFSPPGAPLTGSAPVFSENSAFTPVKVPPITPMVGNSHTTNVSGVKTGKSNQNGSAKSPQPQQFVQIPKATIWLDFKLDAEKLLSVYNESVEKLRKI
uniref:Nudix hydrolase domain-containing protein n=1 Tax=Panagrolaimus sp. JU765 TaxID=591449 RepID=A0AC34RRB2_9BILA